VILINLSGESQSVSTGDRIAQMVIQKVEQVTLKEVEDLEETERGEGGFGHSGKQ
jgi:dUTP pyrophosphatase